MTGRPARGLAFGAACAAIGVLFLLSLAIGSGDVPLETVLAALGDPSLTGPDAAIVRDHRMPRGVVALLAGCALGIAGALTQSLTRNPLAEPGTLGVSSGASLAVAIGIFSMPTLPVAAQLTLALVGATISGAVVLFAGGVLSGRHSTVRLVLTGAAWSALTAAATSYVMLGDARAFQSFRYWHSGAVAPRPWSLVLICAGMMLLGLILVLPILRAIDALGLGDDLGRALGARPHRTWALAGLATVLLASAATALVGPIAFLGLVAPLAVRWFTGPSVGPLVLWSGVAGAGVLLAADIVGRVILPINEVTAGVMCGLIGAPMFVAVARRAKVVSLR